MRSMDAKPLEDLIRILTVGGGMHISASRSVEDLVRLATVASIRRARLVIHGAGAIPTEALIRIGTVGRGSVVFD